MNTLKKSIESNFLNFYNKVYASLSKYEPADELTSENVNKLVSITHSMEMRFEGKSFEYIVSGIIVHTALDHILINGNKRLSLIFGYFCAWWYGYAMILTQRSFAKMIKQIVIEVGKEIDGSKKEETRLNAISALAMEIKDYSIQHNAQKIDCNPVVDFFRRLIS